LFVPLLFFVFPSISFTFVSMVYTYTLNLDVSPQDRWTNLFSGPNNAYTKLLVRASWIPFYVGCVLTMVSIGVWLMCQCFPSNLIFALARFIACTAVWCLTGMFFAGRLIAFGAAWFVKGMYYKELWGISKCTGVHLNLLIFMQFGYEWMSACTTAIVCVGDRLVMFRTMDWMIPMLKGMTIRVRGVKNNRLVFQGITWCGCVTLYTGISHHEKDPFGVAMNCRKSSTPFIYFPFNMFSFLQGRRCSGYAIRHVLENNMSCIEATAYLSRQKYISPSYMTLVSRQGGRVMAHGRLLFGSTNETFISRFVSKEEVNKDNGQMMCQPNHDWWLEDSQVSWWQNRTHTLDRRDFVFQLSTVYDTLDGVFNTFLRPPVKTNDTIYACILDPCDPEKSDIPIIV